MNKREARARRQPVQRASSIDSGEIVQQTSLRCNEHDEPLQHHSFTGRRGLSMSDCPKFRRCNAPICPLDPHWPLRKHRKGESICSYLLELLKPGGWARLRGCVPREIVEKVLATHLDIIARYGPIRRALMRAAKRPSRLGRTIGKRRRQEAA
ncbi:MAG: hypothetical protein ACE1Z4_12505 [Gammaproteobacteria bacterium]